MFRGSRQLVQGQVRPRLLQALLHLLQGLMERAKQGHHASSSLRMPGAREGSPVSTSMNLQVEKKSALDVGTVGPDNTVKPNVRSRTLLDSRGRPQLRHRRRHQRLQL